MTKRIDDLIQDICGAADHPLAPYLRSWCRESRPFVTFLEAHLGKVRKKARLASSGNALSDLLAELAVAAVLARDRRFAVLYEPLPVGGRRGPDFQVTLGTRTLFYVEVTHLHPSAPATADGQDGALKLARVLCDKIGQCPPGAANVLAVVMSPDAHPPDAQGGDLVPAAIRLLDRAAGASSTLSAEGVRAFSRGRGRLSAVALCAQAGDGRIQAVSLWRNPAGKHQLPLEVVKHLTQVS